MRHLQAILLALVLLFAGCTVKYQKTGTSVSPPAPSAVQQAANALAGPIPHNNSSPPAALPAIPANTIPSSLGALPPLPPSPLPENSSVAQALDILPPSLPIVYFYYSPLCPYSMRVSQQIEQLQGKYAGKVQWEKFDVLTQEGYEAFDSMEKAKNLGTSNRVVPIIVAGNKTLIGITEISSDLETQVAALAS